MIQFKVEAHDQQQPASSQSKTAILALGFSLPGVKALCCRQEGQTAPAAHTLTPTCPLSRVLQFWKTQKAQTSVGLLTFSTHLQGFH